MEIKKHNILARSNTEAEQKVIRICARHQNSQSNLLEILLDVQEEFDHIDEASTRIVAKELNITRAEVHGVRTFYTDFSESKKGKCIIKVCAAEACQSMGAEDLIEKLESAFHLQFGETDDNNKITLEPVYCLGNCALAPAVMVGERLIGRANLERVTASVNVARKDA